MNFHLNVFSMTFIEKSSHLGHYLRKNDVSLQTIQIKIEITTTNQKYF